MKEKKHIDRLYQEKLRDFEVTPREEVWQSISAELEGTEKRTPLVRNLWTRLAGVAAVLSLIFLIGDWFSLSQQPQIVNQEKEVQDQNLRDIVNPEEISVAATSEEEPSPEVAATGNNSGRPASAPPEMEVVSRASTLSPLSVKESESLSLISDIPLAESEKERPLMGSSEKDKISLFDKLSESRLETEIAEAGRNKIIISTKAAPIYYGNLGQGNSIDPQFNDNNSQGEITYAYGINIAYAISDRIKIRSGVTKVSMSYNTNGIAYHTAINPAAINSIDFRDDLEIMVAASPIGDKSSGAHVSSANRSSIGSFNPGFLNQKLGYIEVPVELQYSILDNKFAINLIGGASTMFLNENMVSIHSDRLTTKLGEANNLNDVSFSTNIGIGFGYNFSQKFKLNLEPMFKYQINTYSNSGNFQPYYLGVYSGFSFKF